MQLNVKTALPLEPWVVTASPSHLWEIPTMDMTVTNHPSVLSSRGHWGPSPLPSPALLPPQHRGSAPPWGSTTLAPSPTQMPLSSLKIQVFDRPACTPTTLVLAAGVAAWEWREAPFPLTCESVSGQQSKHYFTFQRLLWHGINHNKTFWCNSWD